MSSSTGDWHNRAVSNIFTDFVRIYPWHGTITEDEATDLLGRILGDSGSYWVPVVCHRAHDGAFLDIQHGGGKNTDILDFCDQAEERYDVWGRHLDSGLDEFDLIWHRHPQARISKRTLASDADRPWPCRYGFDEVLVTTNGDGQRVEEVLPSIDSRWTWDHDGDRWRIRVEGSYLTKNQREDMDAKTGPCARRPAQPGKPPRPGGLVTPTTPTFGWGPLVSLEPVSLRPIGGDERPAPEVERVEFLWRGRLVHRAEMGQREDRLPADWRHLGADHWDNCVDERFAEARGRWE